MGRRAKTIMVQGTGSYVGKSVLVTAFCRLFRRAGVKVAPFKAQNMALNSFATVDGGEIGRSQAVQAQAASLAPTVDMNPVLLKPTRGRGSQVVLHGRPIGYLDESTQEAFKPRFRAGIEESMDRLLDAFEVVVIEGAGSPAEINLMEHDLVNMFVARRAEAPVLLVGDIDRGGVFAWLLGTLDLLSAEERRLVKGLIVNKFRGERSMLEPGLRSLEGRCGLPVLGVLPYFTDIAIPQEDGVALEELGTPQGAPSDGKLDVAVVRFPHLANFTDFDALAAEPDVALRYVESPETFGAPDLLVLPGTKATVADLAWLRRVGLDRATLGFAERGGRVVGLCGGYQMLGRLIRDPAGEEAGRGEVAGLGLLEVETTFASTKLTEQVRARHASSGLVVEGYEIHMGQTARAPGVSAAFVLERRGSLEVSEGEGAVDAIGRIMGTNIHGCFDAADFRRNFLDTLRADRGWPQVGRTSSFNLEDEYDRLADLVEAHLDWPAILNIVEEGVTQLKGGRSG